VANGPDATMAQPSSDALRLADLAFAWRRGDRFRLAVSEFRAAPRKRVLLKGASGSGKTTLLSVICGFVRPTAGTVQVIGQDIAALPKATVDRFRAEHVGIIFQMFNLLPYGSAIDNVLLPLSFAPVRRRRATEAGTSEQEARRLLCRLGIPEDLHRRTSTRLSVGQQQRVAVARALIGRPEIVIADEPTSALDRDSQDEFLDLLFEEVGRAGATLLMVSHDETLAHHFDRTLAIDAVTAAA
jgi:putative ABC transport system ATP-binding protein